MNRIAGVFLSVSSACLIAGAALITPVAGVLTAGVLAAVAGVLALDVEPRRRSSQDVRRT